jgi:type IV pilus assembly protein PilB
VDGVEIDFRVSVLPGVLGEKVVIRLLDMSKGVRELGELGMGEEDYRRLLPLIRKTTGILSIAWTASIRYRCVPRSAWTLRGCCAPC